MPKRRADLVLVDRGLVESREVAQRLIAAGVVRAGGETVRRPAALIDPSARLEVERPPRYVSRGGEKLEHALHTFGVTVDGLVCLDLGASTGGFTDCLLQHGAARVYAVDVGRGQLHAKLRSDPRVIVMERTNARDLPVLPEPLDLVTADVSFISLTKVLDPAGRQLTRGGKMVVLLKPQFEAGPAEVGADGVVRDALVHAEVIGRFVSWCTKQGYRLRGLTTSPLKGPAGNREFLLALEVA